VVQLWSGPELSDPRVTIDSMTALTTTDAEILAFETKWWRSTQAKENAIVELFDMSPTLYHQRLTALIDDPVAFEQHPQVVARLRRLRDEGRGRRGR
jgi:hypothetical protein